MLFFIFPLERDCKQHEVLLLFVLSSFIKHLPDAGRKSPSVKLLQEDEVHLSVLHAFSVAHVVKAFIYCMSANCTPVWLQSVCVCVCLKATARVVSTSGQKELSYEVMVLLPSF